MGTCPEPELREHTSHLEKTIIVLEKKIETLGQVVFSDLLLCSVVCTGLDLQHVDLFLCLDFTQRPMNDQKNERSNEQGFHLK